MSCIFYYQAKSKSEKLEPLEPKPERHTIAEFFVAADKALTPSLTFLGAGIFSVVIPLLLINYLSSQARTLANNQIDAYIEKGECTDTFNGNQIGCYTIPNENGDDKLIVFNDDHKLIFLSVDSSLLPDGKTTQKIFHLNLKDKSTGEKITRLLKKKVK